MNTAQLASQASVVLDASGDGQCSVGPTGSGEQWTTVAVSCHVSSNASEAICSFYVGTAPAPQFYSGGTTWGSTGDSAQWSGAPIVQGQQVYASWTGGDPGATAYLNVTGVRQVA